MSSVYAIDLEYCNIEKRFETIVADFQCPCNKKTIYPNGKVYCKHLIDSLHRKLKKQIDLTIRKELEFRQRSLAFIE